MGGKRSGISKLRKTPRPGPDPLRRVDRRAAAVRDFIARREQITADLGDDTSTVMASAVDRYCFLEGRVRAMESAAMQGRPVDMPAYLSAVGVLVKLADRLGYQRRARRVPSLRDYMLQHADAPPTASESGPGVCHVSPERCRADDPPSTIEASPFLTSGGPKVDGGEASSHE